jgi:PAS domain S-box-containing protein
MTKPSASSADWEGGSRRSPLTTAVALALAGLLASATLGWLSFNASRQQILQGLFDGHLALARALAAHLEVSEAPDPEAALAELTAIWNRSQEAGLGAYLCVVGPDGQLVLHSGRPALVGTYVGDRQLEMPDNSESETLQQLLRERRDWVGLSQDVEGVQQLAAYAYSPKLRGFVAVHLARAELGREIRTRAVPWALGLIGVVALFLLALATLASAHARQRRQLTDALAELGASQARYKDLYDNAPDMFLSVGTASGNIRDCNETLARALGRTKGELLGTYVLDIYDEPSRQKVLDSLDEFKRTGIVRDLELRLRPGSGPPIDVLLNASATRDAAGTVVASRSILRDISALKRAEQEKDRLVEQLRHSQRLESLGTLAGGIAHDFNNILLSIAGYTELITDELAEGSPGHSHLTEVLKAADRAKALVGNILTFSRKRPPHRVAINLRDVVQEAADFLRATISSRIDIDLDLGNAEPYVLADANQLHQVIVNLGLNASQAMGSKEGTIAITLDTPDGDRARIRVRDTGPGMEPEVLSRIFEPYFTTRDTDEGTGLGLAVVDGILQAHDGSIAVTSEPGAGAEFDVRLPIIEHEAAEQAAAPAARPQGGGESILVLDDEPGLTRLAERRLGGLGYKVTCATEVEGARQAMADGTFDLLITDQNLRKATGVDFVAELRAAGHALPVILATGTPDEIEPAVSERLSIDRVLAKPYSLDQLAATVREVLDYVQT